MGIDPVGDVSTIRLFLRSQLFYAVLILCYFCVEDAVLYWGCSFSLALF